MGAQKINSAKNWKLLMIKEEKKKTINIKAIGEHKIPQSHNPGKKNSYNEIIILARKPKKVLHFQNLLLKSFQMF